ncbi:phosphopantetheine-binding protein [Lentzea flava]|uniref:Acyl carrier protein n=1 Tax=Lentzea flava TaxID=103732 RepID=A0ABQ2UGS3_9PSEU|nr:phosphopantetheine-binding protein [Lentzea flava]MCP2199002.1 polyketide biosynthesis acyl carrier protein [Lentzea flava]GGU32355.1 acyl carrier protein [Lentzea flava]
MTEQEIFAVVRRHLVDVLPDLDESRIQLDRSMKDLGANSIDRMDVVIGVQDELGVTVPASAMKDVHDLRSLVVALQAHS